jgi:polar amino acid transport system permease protein
MNTAQELTRPAERAPQSAYLANIPWWALILAASGLILIYLILSDQNYYETFIFLQAGVAITLRITLIAFPISTVIGLLTGLARMSKNVIPYTIATLYIEVIRGIPIVVLILMIAFGVVPIFVGIINQVGEWGLSWSGSGFTGYFFNSLATYNIRSISFELRAIIALAIAYGAFEAEIFRAGIQSIGRGQMEAARSLGMSYFQSMRYIILPQAVRRVLPPLGNDFIAMLKDSSLATVLAVNELTQLTRIRRSSTFRIMEAFNVAAFLYLAMTLVLSAVVGFMEKRLRVVE